MRLRRSHRNKIDAILINNLGVSLATRARYHTPTRGNAALSERLSR